MIETKALKPTEDTSVYIVFSSTPYKMGRMIRLFTRGIYNHVSVALDRDLSELYSFARLYRQTPFCGGFVRESSARYSVGKKNSKVLICEVSTTADKKAMLRRVLREMQENSDIYIYNFFSAVCVPFKKRIHIKDSYTCVEFVIRVFNILGYEFPEKNFYSINDLFNILWNNIIYEGEFPGGDHGLIDDYEKNLAYKSRYSKTFKQLETLVFRLIQQ